MKYAIIGNPNCGKTTIFNALTGLKHKVGNWSGVTVDKAVGKIQYNEQQLEIVDLPGVYTLTTSNDSSIDEKIATNFIAEEKPNVIINVIDASNFERNLYLTMQLLETEIPLILVINMIDTANKKGIVIDYQKLQMIIGCTVIPIISRKKIGINELKKSLFTTVQKKSKFDLNSYYPEKYKILKNKINEFKCNNSDTQWIIASAIENKFDEMEIELATSLYQAINDVVKKTVAVKNISRYKENTNAIDAICMNKYLGIPTFLLIMYLMFEFSINIGGMIQPIFDNVSHIIFIKGAMYLGYYLELPTWVITIIAQGIGLGINTIVNFIPQIGCMFIFLSFLEDSGYMARAAYVMDRFMQTIGLPGKAFVPLIIGFGCNVPSIMATRTLEARNDRLMTIMMAPFMSCGARLTIFTVFAAAFFPKNNAIIIFALYITGIAVAIITGYFIKFALLAGNNSPFVMELPIYHFPNFKMIILNSLNRLKTFIFKAGKLILPICIVIGTLNNIYTPFISHSDKNVDHSQLSILATLGHTITPLFKPMGISEDNWQATVGLLTGILAKEVIIGTLNTLYTQEQEKSEPYLSNYKHSYEKFGSWKELMTSWNWYKGKNDDNFNKSAMNSMITSFESLAAVFSYLLFILLYIPCISVIGVMSRETTRSLAFISIVWSTSIAYVSAVIFYQTVHITFTPLQSIGWVISMLTYILLLVICIKYLAKKIHFETEFDKLCDKKCCSS